MNINILYPQVHDLSEAETNAVTATPSSAWCGDTSFLWVEPPNCFSLQDLVNPTFSAMPFSTTTTTTTTTSANKTNTSGEIASKKHHTGSFFFGNSSKRRQAAAAATVYQNSIQPISLVDDRDDADDDLDDSRQLAFHEVYALTKEIHRGKICDVWETVHKSTGNRYATKIIDRRRVTPSQEDQMLAEASLLHRIREDILLQQQQLRSSTHNNNNNNNNSIIVSHPPIVAGVLDLVDFFEEDTHIYTVTNYMEGGDLLTRILRGPLFPEKDMALITKSILFGLRYLHSRRICHRNLKPQNILIESHELLADCWKAVVADLGAAIEMLADSDGDLLPLTERLPSPASAYTAPEILLRHSYGTQSDMWSLGVIVYHALVGRVPFRAGTKKELFQRIIKADYTFDTKMGWNGISREGKRFVASLLHVDPSVRMTAEEAMEHPWIAQLKEEEEGEGEGVVEGIIPTHQVGGGGRGTSGMINKQHQLRTKDKLKGLWKVIKGVSRPSLIKNNSMMSGTVKENSSMDEVSVSSHTFSLMSSSDVPSSNNSGSVNNYNLNNFMGGSTSQQNKRKYRG
eukprot:CAMPEP_0202446814 /NCGR_PEP_ID=MMETSP1360-20130828/5388_1 /ASSEMBLY_ACC=CAM_ASM_000848 /TAXON_ID=515479 /ORGANISM="Licmophora paradoxa, Strain CCMP2313" /LENGTH=569 /DNA_ID=CAMNT_0049063521 /DNA_START=119 /DNA_END=1828 /DNA_ORIENTATION=+